MTNSPEGYLNRRAFLGIAVGGGGAVALPGPASGATARGPAASGTAARTSGPGQADWAALARDLSGTLVRPGESAYLTAKLLFDPRFDGQHPAGIAYVKSPHDVSTCLAFVRKFKVPFAARSGGHGYAGWSGSAGLVIDVSDMKTVAVSGSTATAGAGTRLIDFYNGLAARSRAVPGGVCPTVGLAGFTLGGGVGVFARAYSLTCDNLNAMLSEAGCATIGYEACHLPWYAGGGTLRRQAQFSKSDFFMVQLSGAGIGALLAGVDALRATAGAPGGIGGIQLDPLGGAVNRVKPWATAFVHRNALFMAQYTTDWYAGATSGEIGAQHAWIRSFWSSMRRYASGQAYVNYIDPDLAGWRHAYYGANYNRLAAVKRRYDPTGLFTFPQAITPTA